MEKNICLITVDSLRSDHLGCYGYKRNTSPNIDALANNGIICENAFTNNSATTESFSSMFTSQYPFIGSINSKPVNSFQPSFVERLKEAGYSTAGFHSNPYLMDYNGFNRGFDHFFDSFSDNNASNNSTSNKSESSLRKLVKKNKHIKRLAKRVITSLKERDMGYTEAPGINKLAIDWLRKNKEKKLFLWVHYMDVHVPYIPNKESLEKIGMKNIPSEKKMWKMNDTFNNTRALNHLKGKDIDMLIDLYDGGIRYTDDAIGELIEAFKSLNIFDSTCFFFTADHGDEFMEHGSLGHLSNLYDELLRIPLIIHRSETKENIIIKTPVSHVDLAPTISSVSGTSNDGFIGSNVFDYIHNENLKRYIVAEDLNLHKNKKIRALRTLKWKYIINEFKNTEELYNLSKDRQEKNNLASKEKEILDNMKFLMNEHVGMETKRSEEIEKAKINEALSKKNIF